MMEAQRSNLAPQGPLMTEQELEELAAELARRRMSSPEFADLAALEAEADRIGACLARVSRRRGLGRPADLPELAGVASELSRHQDAARRVFRAARMRALE